MRSWTRFGRSAQFLVNIDDTCPARPEGERRRVRHGQRPPDWTVGTPASGPRLTGAYGLKVRSGSPAINKGAVISDNGGHDDAGTPLYNGTLDIGAFEVG
jgi:hypothetical protein